MSEVAEVFTGYRKWFRENIGNISQSSNIPIIIDGKEIPVSGELMGKKEGDLQIGKLYYIKTGPKMVNKMIYHIVVPTRGINGCIHHIFKHMSHFNEVQMSDEVEMYEGRNRLTSIYHYYTEDESYS